MAACVVICNRYLFFFFSLSFLFWGLFDVVWGGGGGGSVVTTYKDCCCLIIEMLDFFSY